MQRLILASASKARASLLQNAGLEIECHPANIDEARIKDRMLANGHDPSEIAPELACEKARTVSNLEPSSLVIGADQVLIHRGKLFDKPRSMAEARHHLMSLRGSSHDLISAVAVVQEGKSLWTTSTAARLHMRPFSDAFLDGYLDRFGTAALTSVGAYHLEGLGAQLFDRIEGDYFTILGLPLLELLAFLRSRDMVPA